MTRRIYLVEDEENLNMVLSKYLEKEGYIVKSFLDGNSALAMIKDSPDLWILDIMLPDIDGYELIKAIKHFDEDVPVIFMSARNEDVDRVIGLELGSEDYLPKPFLPRELVIRTNKLIKRVYSDASDKSQKRKSIGDYVLDESQRVVLYNDESIVLTNKEYELLKYLAENKMLAISREQILDYVWGDDYFGSDRVVDDTVRRLRKKLERLNIETIYGYGYKMVIE